MAKSSKHSHQDATQACIYRLSGPQVEPGASYWNRCPVPCPVPFADLIAITDDSSNPNFFPDYPTSPVVVGDEFQELLDLQKRREDPTQLSSTEPGRERLPISMFLQLRPQPLGAVTNSSRGMSFPTIANGSELARYFENETPGLAHQLALNFMIRDTNWSPPRQALVWATLHVAILSALSAAWYYKWLSPRPNVSRRCRPIEYAIANGAADADEDDTDDQFTVLFDRAINCLGCGNDGHRPNCPPVAGFIASSPGTPRHPAYPSGHSTYSAAASEVLSFFFPDYRRELDQLADNIGIARLWAGIHWRSDHVEGARLGRTVACLIIRQLRESGIPLVPMKGPDMTTQTPPSISNLDTAAEAFSTNCGQAEPGSVPGLRNPVSKACVQIPDPEEEAITDPDVQARGC